MILRRHIVVSTMLFALLAATPLHASPGQEAETSATPLAQETQPTNLVVRVVDDAGAPVANQEVFLVVNDGQQVTDELTANTSADGEAHFTDVAVGAGYAARPIAVYEEFPYQGDAVPLTPGDSAILTVTVRSLSDTPANLHIDVLHIILTAVEPGLFQALQVMNVLNVDDRAAYGAETFEGQQVGTIIPLPSNAINFTPLPANISGLNPARTAFDGSRVLDLRPVPPGGHQLAVQYELTTDDGGDVEITLPYPTEQVSMLVGPRLGMVDIESDQLQPLDPVQIPQQGDYASYSSDVIAAGGTLRFRIAVPGTPISVQSWSLLALASALLASAVASLLFAGGPAPDPGERRRLLAMVAQLDAQHESQAVDTPQYHAERAIAISRLMELDGTKYEDQDEAGA